MAHELESMFYVMGENEEGRPWHGLGTPVNECLTSEEAIVGRKKVCLRLLPQRE